MGARERCLFMASNFATVNEVLCVCVCVGLHFIFVVLIYLPLVTY